MIGIDSKNGCHGFVSRGCDGSPSPSTHPRSCRFARSRPFRFAKGARELVACHLDTRLRGYDGGGAEYYGSVQRRRVAGLACGAGEGSDS